MKFKDVFKTCDRRNVFFDLKKATTEFCYSLMFHFVYFFCLAFFETRREKWKLPYTYVDGQQQVQNTNHTQQLLISKNESQQLPISKKRNFNSVYVLRMRVKPSQANNER